MWPDCRGRHKPYQLPLPPDRGGLPEHVQVTVLEGETEARKTVTSSFASWMGEACSPLARTNQEMHCGTGHANRYSVSMPRLDSWRLMPRLSRAAGQSGSKKVDVSRGLRTAYLFEPLSQSRVFFLSEWSTLFATILFKQIIRVWQLRSGAARRKMRLRIGV